MRPTPRNPELEAAIVSEPESPDAFLVYGDWLLEMGEPLGELVSVQAALAKVLSDEGGAESRKAMILQQREAALLLENEKNWIGHFKRYPHTWSFGFLESIKLDEPDRGDCVDVLELVAARFLRELEIELLGHRAFENSEVVSALAEVGLPPILRKLTLQPGGNGDPRAVDIGSVRSLWPRLARLKELVIRAGNVMFGAIHLPMVETVRFTTNASPEMINAITRASWPQLRELTLDLTEQGRRFDGSPPLDMGLFEPLIVALGQRGGPEELAEKKQTPLTHFALTGHLGGDMLVEILRNRAPELLASPHLTSLDLARSGLTDVGGQAILDEKRFARLAKLNLSGNYLALPMVESIKKAFGDRAILADQGPNYYAPNYGGDGEEDYDDEDDGEGEGEEGEDAADVPSPPPPEEPEGT